MWVSAFTPVKQERGTAETIQQYILLCKQRIQNVTQVLHNSFLRDLA